MGLMDPIGLFSTGVMPGQEPCVAISFGGEESHAHKQTRYRALHNQFVASAKVVQLAHAMDPEFKIGCMIAGSCVYPLTCNPDDILAAQREMYKGNYYCGDVMVRGAYGAMAKRILKEEQIDLDIQPGDEEILKKGTVDFYSFSYYSSNCATGAPQEAEATGNLSVGAKNPYLKASDWGWTIDTKGLR